MLTLGIYGIIDTQNVDNEEVHDHNVTLVKNGEVLKYLHLERITRKKQDNALPFLIENIVDELQIKEEFRIVYVDSFIGNTFTSNSNILNLFIENRIDKPELKKAIGFFKNKPIETWICSHELAHVGSNLPFWGNFKNNSLHIHIDAGASISNCSAWYYRDSKLNHLEHSWELHTIAKNFCCNKLAQNILNEFSELSLAGKLMGFSGFGKYSKKLHDWLRKNDWFMNIDSFQDFFNSAETEMDYKGKSFNMQDQFFKDIAYCMQYDFENQIYDYIVKHKKITGADYLYYSGGAALNIITNSVIENKRIFKNIFISPCCNDSGLSLGAASLLEFTEGIDIKVNNPFLNSHNLPDYTFNPDFKIKDIADKLIEGEVIGICLGNGEIGPRALGHRSLLALPNSIEIRNHVSINIKKREWYRPVAPIMLKSLASEYFNDIANSNLSCFMLGNYRVNETKRKQIEGVIHIDGTARVQTVDDNDENNRLIVEILKFIYDNHQIPCLINTSFNEKGFPIVHTEEDAIKEASKMGIKYIVINNKFKILT